MNCDKKGCTSEGFVTHINTVNVVPIDVGRGIPLAMTIPVVLCQKHNREWYMSAARNEKVDFVEFMEDKTTPPKPESKIIQLHKPGKGAA